jgi:hypothetical protein
MWRSNSWKNLSSLYIGIGDFHIIFACEAMPPIFEETFQDIATTIFFIQYL